MVVMELEVPDSFPRNLEIIREANDISSLGNVLPFLVNQELEKIADGEQKIKRFYESMEILNFLKTSIVESMEKLSLKDIWGMIKEDFPAVAGKDFNNGYFVAVINAICLNYTFKNIYVNRRSPLDIDFMAKDEQVEDVDDVDLTNLACLLEVLKAVNINKHDKVAYRDIRSYAINKSKLSPKEYEKAWNMVVPDLFGETSSWKLGRTPYDKPVIIKSKGE